MRNGRFSNFVEVFNERKDEFKYNTFLSQPEILLIWYFIEKEEFKLTNEWQKYYDIEELKDLAIWWGKPID